MAQKALTPEDREELGYLLYRVEGNALSGYRDHWRYLIDSQKELYRVMAEALYQRGYADGVEEGE